ncbi:hypothetical protein [Flavobacterium sp.]|uniref:hypothetical protein n=1 Tax=Flavobacterium sp. TaxID=239 RepID=UPI0039E67C6A
MESKAANNNLFYQILFAICVGVTYLNIYELTFAIWSFSLLISLRRKYSLTLVHYLLCFVAIFGIALTVSFFREYKLYNFFRDISYLLKPILGLVVGYQLCRNLRIKPFETIAYTGLGIAVIHMILIFYNALLHHIVNIHELRHFTGYFSDFEIYALLVLIFSKELEIKISAEKRWLFILIIAVSSALYVSRTNFLQLIILYLAMKGYFKITTRAVIVMSLVIAGTLIGYAIIYNMTLTRNGRGLEGFLYKVKNAPIEAFKSKVDEDDWEDFNDNYRSYETIITLKQVSSGGWTTILFGKGMGATIDVGREMWTNDGEFIRYVPTLHNGYMTVYLKSGVVGIFFSVVFMILLTRQRQRKTDTPLIKNINLFLSGTGIFLFLANWVLLGLYLKIDNKSLIIGLILCYKELLVKQSLLPKNEES